MTSTFEDRVREDLHAAAGEVAFDHLDPASVIGLGRRAARRRGLSRAAAATAVSLAALAVGVALGDTAPRRAVAPVGTATSSTPSTASTATARVNAGAFGSRSELRPAGSTMAYTVRGLVSDGHRFAALENSVEGVPRTVAGLRLDRPELADVAYTDGPLAILVTQGPVDSIRMGSTGFALDHLGSAPVAGTSQWLTVASIPASWTKPWQDLAWTTGTGKRGAARMPASFTATIPAKGGGAGWSPLPVRFTARPTPTGTALVEVEKADSPTLGLQHLGLLTLDPGQSQEFARGDGGAYATLYGLTRSKPVSVAPRGDTAARFVDGWTFTTVEVTGGVWATAIQLTGMDDSSPDPVPSVSWTDGTGASHSFDLP
ncbi:hypothetical protein [Pedococcus soli]